MKWVRFKSNTGFDQGDYWHPSTSSNDAIIFKPKLPIKFIGFGCWASHARKTMKLVYWWFIDGEKSEEYPVDLEPENADPEKNWHEIDIRELGCSPIFVGEGQKIEIVFKSREEGYDGNNYMIYGNGGDSFREIDGQDYDFDIERSDKDNNGTGTSMGQYPFIMYARA